MSKLSIADMLQLYSKESDEGETYASDAAEDAVTSDVEGVVEDVESEEIDEAVIEGVEVIEEGSVIESSTEQLIDAAESLESSIGFIRDLRERNEVLSGAATGMWTKAVVASMEARGIPVDLFESELVGFGDSFENNQYEDYSVEAEDKGEGIFRRLWNMIKAAFARLGQWITRFVGWFRTSAGAVRKAAVKLQTAAGEKSKAGMVHRGGKINVAPFSNLVFNGRVDAPASVSILQSALDVSMDTATAFASSAVKEAENFGKGSSFWTKLVPAFMRDLKTTAEKFANNQTIAALPGGRTIEAYGAEGKRFNFFGKQRFTFKLRVERDKNFKGATGMADPLSLREIESLGGSLVALVDSAQAKFEAFESAFGKMKLVDVPKGEKGEVGTTDARLAAQLLQSTMLAAQRIPSAIGPIVFPIAKRAYLYGKVCLNQYGKAK